MSQKQKEKRTQNLLDDALRVNSGTEPKHATPLCTRRNLVTPKQNTSHVKEYTNTARSWEKSVEETVNRGDLPYAQPTTLKRVELTAITCYQHTQHTYHTTLQNWQPLIAYKQLHL